MRSENNELPQSVENFQPGNGTALRLSFTAAMAYNKYLFDVYFARCIEVVVGELSHTKRPFRKIFGNLIMDNAVMAVGS